MPAQEADIILALRGERAVQAGMGETALSVRGLRNALIEANAEMDMTRRRSFLMNQALFTARRLLYAGTLTLIGFTAAVATMGFRFNMTMENNTVAMTQFLGSASAAKQELGSLYQIAATTPFEFTDIVDATRRFLAFGFSLQQTNRYLRIIGDTAAAFGGGADQIQRMVLVFGQMRAAGRVLGQDLLQLEQIGVPALQILQEQLGLTQDQMANIGRLHIPAGVAIEALMRGLDERFRGLSAKQAKTLQGRVSTLHDYAARLFGTLTLPLYNRLRDYAIPNLTALVNQMQQAAKTGGIRGALHVVDVRYGTSLARMFDDISRAAQGFWGVMKGAVIPILVFLNQNLQPIHVILLAVGMALGFFAHHTTLAKIALSILLLEFVRFRTMMIVFGGPGGRGGLVGKIIRGIGLGADGPAAFSLIGRFRAWKNMIVLTRITAVKSWAYMAQAWMALTKGFVQGASGQIVKINALSRAILFLRTSIKSAIVAMWAAVVAGTAMTRTFIAARWAAITLWIALLSPLEILLLIIFAVVVILGVLYWKWAAFRHLINFIGREILHGIVVAFKTLVHWIKQAVHWLGKIHMPHIHIPGSGLLGHIGLQEGGMVQTAGAFLVGERGPELAMLPAGSAVSPISATNFPVQNFFNNQVDGRPIEVHVFLDGKQIQKSVAKRNNDTKARA